MNIFFVLRLSPISFLMVHPLFMEQVCMKIDSSLNFIDNVITNGCSQWSYRLLISCTFHLRPKFTANNNNNTIRVPINSQVCILYAQKMKRKHSFLPLGGTKTGSGWPKNLRSSWHVLPAPILSLVGTWQCKRVYSILSGLQH